MLQQIKRIMGHFSSLSLGMRITIGSLLGVVGSSSFLGFVTEFATYNYAFSNGVRIPTEGVSYLSFFISIVSLGLMFTALACFVGLFFVLRLFIQIAIAHIGKEKFPEEISKLPVLKYLAIAVPGAVAGIQLLFSLRSFFPSFYSATPQYISIGIPTFILIAVLVCLRKPDLIKIFVTASFGCFVIFGLYAMFTPKIYGDFLRLIRYGGGLNIEISRKCADLSKCTSPTNGKLFLRTKDYFILVDQTKSNVSEIPAADVLDYIYPSENKNKRD